MPTLHRGTVHAHGFSYCVVSSPPKCAGDHSPETADKERREQAGSSEFFTLD
jgi:hypothetical protein